MSGSKIGTRSKLAIAAIVGLFLVAGCVPTHYGYYDPYPYGYSGYSGGAVVLNYSSGRPYHGHRHYRGRGGGHRHWR